MTIKLNRLGAQAYVTSYNRASALSVCGAYKHPSDAKIRAEKDILRKMAERKGWGYKIISRTCQFFTAGYLFENPDTGAITLCIHTPRHIYETEWEV